MTNLLIQLTPEERVALRGEILRMWLAAGYNHEVAADRTPLLKEINDGL